MIIKKNNKLDKKCYLSPDNLDLKIIHLIITRFELGFSHLNDTTKEYTLNGIRVMKKYLLFLMESLYPQKIQYISKKLRVLNGISTYYLH
jgi:hypothetical protein